MTPRVSSPPTNTCARRARTPKLRRIVACVAAAVALVACGAAAGQAPWPPAEFAEKLKAEPKTEVDKALKELIAEYEKKIAELKQDEPLISANLPRLRRKLLPLYQEYNQDKKRYRGDHFPPGDCMKRFRTDMDFTLKALGEGKHPPAASVGRWQTRVCWIERTNVMGHFDLIVPRSYDPKKPSPLVISYQDDPDMDQMRTKTPYFLIRCIQKGYPTGLTYVENKTRTYLKEAARDYNIDPFRIYATGFSYGGRTDLIMAWRHPHWFAAIAPLCNDLRKPPSGIDQTPYVKQLKNVPTLLLHGTGDSFLSTGKIVHQYMQEAGCPVEFQTYPGGHSADGLFRKDVTVLTNFFDKHVMNPYPKMVSHVVEHNRYSRAFWVNAKLVKDAGGMQGVFEVRVKEGNRIEIDANEQVAELELDLNDKLVDMKRPVTVVAGEKKLYEGMPSEKLKVKLREGEPHEVGPGDQLWKDLLEIKKESVYMVGG